MCGLMCPDHGLTQNGWEIDLRIVEDPVYEVSSVVHQHTPISGREYAIGEYLVKNLDNGLTQLMR